MTFRPDYFEIIRETEQMTGADIDRVRSLLNREDLPSSAKGSAGGVGDIPACVVCQSNPCVCEPEAA